MPSMTLAVCARSPGEDCNVYHEKNSGHHALMAADFFTTNEDHELYLWLPKDYAYAQKR